MRALLLIALLALAACSPEPSPAEHVLTYGSPYPPTHPFSRADITWMQTVERESGGRIKFKPYWSGSLLSSSMSMLEVRHGLVDIGLITPIYTRGGAHMLRAQSGFYGGVRDIAEQVGVYKCLAGAFPDYTAELRGLHVLAVQGGNFPGVVTRTRPIKTLEDFAGKRLRAPTENVDVLKALGADPVNMPMGEVYSALAKGVIDGVVAPADTIQSLHFGEVAKYFTQLHVPRGAYPARAMSDQAWRRLPGDLQALLRRSNRVWEAALMQQLLAAEEAGTKYGHAHGIQFEPLTQEEQDRFARLYNDKALHQAQLLSAIGLDGVPVFEKAQALIAARAPQCEATE
ncbi:C4-dicarboxylate ABC transporter substrate-binding protein [Rhodospirillales bacterium TMPK1]|uniref:C4-dicarboxylate ABC transporter substrate-binding protein n=2 Tax=Roseiterribacter gracilis TaxID=2812848 RepID=A0A8S8XIU5_9PROT|nr:C4-dicarboxylate ABC transporter substrate-binding protein [Rhodospirillales bacterium TMPK1]